MATSVSRCDWSSNSALIVGFCYGNRANYVRKVMMGFWMLSFHNDSCQKHEWNNSAYGFTSALAVTEVHLIPIYCSARILPAQQLLPRSSWNSWSESTRGDICAAKKPAMVLNFTEHIVETTGVSHSIVVQFMFLGCTTQPWLYGRCFCV
jgi:hypothetical protein